MMDNTHLNNLVADRFSGHSFQSFFEFITDTSISRRLSLISTVISSGTKRTVNALNRIVSITFELLFTDLSSSSETVFNAFAHNFNWHLAKLRREL